MGVIWKRPGFLSMEASRLFSPTKEEEKKNKKGIRGRLVA